ncbi:MAG: RepB family plasmid replication initiator protein [Cytophagaceae bacterium]|nr:MAG: RepB family plasmid replication initiator protein [Cytophagaceae bacterium]
MYRNLKSWTDIGRWAPNLEDFWEVMEIPEDSSYRRDFKGLRLRVIEPAVASINAKTDLRIEWRPMTSGTRKVTSIDFRVASDGKNNPLVTPGAGNDYMARLLRLLDQQSTK